MSAQKKPTSAYLGLYADSPTPDKGAVEDLKKKINGLLLQDPKMALKAARILEMWLRHKPK